MMQLKNPFPVFISSVTQACGLSNGPTVVTLPFCVYVTPST